jgi:chemotaxis protein MotB
MSKKKHPEHVNHERWLVSYADFITLLFAFFVVLFASGQSDKRKTIKLAEAMQSAFQYNGIFDQHSRTPPLSDTTAPPTAVPSPVSLPIPSALASETIKQVQAEAAVQKHIEDVIKAQVDAHRIGAAAVTLHPSPEGIVISLREAGFFDSGSAEVRPDSLEVLHTIAAALPRQPMRIEGHTDNVPIHTAQFATNWELSTARAADITRLLIAENSADPAQVSAAGYAEFHPVAENDTEAGRKKNRRVDIVLLRSTPTLKSDPSDGADLTKDPPPKTRP